MTWRGYEHLVRLHIQPAIGHVPLAKLGPQHIQALLHQKAAEGRLAARTVHYMHSVIRAALNTAVRWGLVHINAAALVSAPRVAYAETPVLTPEQTRQLLEATSGDRLEALYSVALGLGFRQCEALGLRWSDVDLEAGTLRIRRAAQRIPHVGIAMVETKTVRGRRTLLMPPTVVARLREHRLAQLEERLAAGEDWKDNDLVFASELGTALDGPNVTHPFRRLLDRAGLRRMRFHDLRHACASPLLAQRVHPRVVWRRSATARSASR
jgi:integrase